MGKKGRGKRNKENSDDFASLLPSITRWRSKRNEENADDFASPLPSITRAGTIYALFHPVKMEENTTQLDTGAIAAQAVASAAAVEAAAAATTHELRDEDPKTVEVFTSINAELKLEHNAELKLEQLSIGTAAQTVTNAAAEKAAAGAATFERAAAEQTVVIGAGEQAAAINADAEAAATVSNLHEDIKRLQAAADEATATINNLEAENKRLVLLLAAAKAAATAKTFVPGYNIPMTHAEHLQALQRQIQYLQGLLHAQAIPAADRAIMAATANVAETAMAQSGTRKPQRALMGEAHSITTRSIHCQEHCCHLRPGCHEE